MEQIGGNHYDHCVIDPNEYASKNKLLFFEGCVLKYITRHQRKGKKEDILKAKHYLDLIIKRDYE